MDHVAEHPVPLMLAVARASAVALPTSAAGSVIQAVVPGPDSTRSSATGENSGRGIGLPDRTRAVPSSCRAHQVGGAPVDVAAAQQGLDRGPG